MGLCHLYSFGDEVLLNKLVGVAVLSRDEVTLPCVHFYNCRKWKRRPIYQLEFVTGGNLADQPQKYSSLNITTGWRQSQEVSAYIRNNYLSQDVLIRYWIDFGAI